MEKLNKRIEETFSRLLANWRSVIWFVPIYVFFMSMLMWMLNIIWFKIDVLDESLSRVVYYPVLASILGCCVALILKICTRNIKSIKIYLVPFIAYVLSFGTWSYYDISRENCQVRSCGIGHSTYEHMYFTWWFVPYDWIYGLNKTLGIRIK